MNTKKWSSRIFLSIICLSLVPCFARRSGGGRKGRSVQVHSGVRARGAGMRSGVGFRMGVRGGTGYRRVAYSPHYRYGHGLRRTVYAPYYGYGYRSYRPYYRNYWWSVGSPSYWWWNYRYQPEWSWLGSYPLFWSSLYGSLIQKDRWDDVVRQLSNRISRLEDRLEEERLKRSERKQLLSELENLVRHRDYAQEQID